MKASEWEDALYAHVDYLEQSSAAWVELTQLINGVEFDSFNNASQAGSDYVDAMAPTAPYDDGTVEGAVTEALDRMVMASSALADVIQERLDANAIAAEGLDYEINGQYEEAVTAYLSAAYHTMALSWFASELWSLADSVDNANFWLANWPQAP